MVSVTFTGWAELTKAFKALDNELRPVMLTKALVVAAEPLRARMASLAVRGTEAPHIADHVVISPSRSLGFQSVGREGGATTDEEATVAVGPAKNVFYARWVEYGHHNGQGQRPFMRPAFDETSSVVIERIAAELWKLIEKNAPTGIKK